MPRHGPLSSGPEEFQMHNLQESHHPSEDEYERQQQLTCKPFQRRKECKTDLQKLFTPKISLLILSLSLLGGVGFTSLSALAAVENDNGQNYHNHNINMNNVNQEHFDNGKVYSPSINLMDGVVKIKSYMDLQNVKGFPETLDIISLTSKKPKDPFPKPKGQFYITVSTLWISGMINEEWLQYLIIFLTELNQLHINMDGLCEGSSESDRSKLKPLYIEGLRQLSIEESHICTIINWIFKWRIPNLKTVSLSQVDFNKKSFSEFCSFLERNIKSIELVEMYHCSFCDQCNLSQIPVEILKQNKLIVYKGNEKF